MRQLPQQQDRNGQAAETPHHECGLQHLPFQYGDIQGRDHPGHDTAGPRSGCGDNHAGCDAGSRWNDIASGYTGGCSGHTGCERSAGDWDIDHDVRPGGDHRIAQCKLVTADKSPRVIRRVNGLDKT